MSANMFQLVVFNSEIKNEKKSGRGIGRGDHFLSYKFIERTIEH